jgi:hypothetical protein
MSCKDSGSNSAVLSGTALIVFGGLLLLSQMGIIHNWFNFWATVFIFVGVLNAFQSERSRPWGILLIAAGVLIELHQLGFVNLRIETYWPILIIAAGGVMVWRAFQQPAMDNDGLLSPHLNVRSGEAENTASVPRTFAAAIWLHLWEDSTSICATRTSRATRRWSTSLPSWAAESCVFPKTGPCPCKWARSWEGTA